MKSFFKKLDIFKVIKEDSKPEVKEETKKEEEQKKETPKEDDGVIIINPEPLPKKEGVYALKYKEKIAQLKLSKPIYLQRESMKINVDKDIVNYLFDDLNNIFKEKNAIISENQSELLTKIQDSSNLITYFYESNRSTDENLTIFTKENELMNQIDNLEKYIDSLSLQTEELEKDLTEIESKLNK